MKNLILTVLTAVVTLNTFAQDEKRNKWFEVEVDPIAYGLQGYSLHGIFVENRIRTDFGIFGIMQPEGFSGNEGFRIKTKGFGLKVNYLLNKKQTWFAGVGCGYTKNSIVLETVGETQTENAIGIGAHVGYRWFILRKADSGFRNLYAAPWCSIDYTNPVNKVHFAAKGYKHKQVSFFPTVHIGFKF